MKLEVDSGFYQAESELSIFHPRSGHKQASEGQASGTFPKARRDDLP